MVGKLQNGDSDSLCDNSYALKELQKRKGKRKLSEQYHVSSGTLLFLVSLNSIVRRMKVNFKLGGTPHLLKDDAMWYGAKDNTMLVGADVTHPLGPQIRLLHPWRAL